MSEYATRAREQSASRQFRAAPFADATTTTARRPVPGTTGALAAALNATPAVQATLQLKRMLNARPADVRPSLKQLQRDFGAKTTAVAQRLAYSDMPYPNLAPRDLLTVTKSGAGTTGVYLAAEGRQLAVVVKFLDKGEAFRTAIGDKFMATGTGLDTPQSRVIPAGVDGNGNQEIKQALRAHATDERPNDRLKQDVADDTSDRSKSVLLMSPVANVSLKDLATGRAGERKDDEHGRLVTVLSDAQVARDFARIIVSDALLSNSDRFLKDADPARRSFDDAVNTSNIFLSGDLQRGVALDNLVEKAGARKSDTEKGAKGALSQQYTYMIRYVAQPTIAADIAKAVVKSCLFDAGEITDPTWDADHTTLMMPLAVIIRPAEQALARNLAAAIPEAITQVLETLHSTKKALREDYYQIGTSSGYTLESAKKLHGTRASQEVDYNQLRARAKMLKKLAKNYRDEGAAEKRGRKHLKHKRKKEK
jgi:hypothetical protein